MSLRKFEILEMIAKGGMAEVYRARTVGLEGFAKELCVKKILPHLTEDKSFVQMFIDEAKLAATLSNSNIVSVHDLCVSADREYFIVMEYVHGKDLSDVIRTAQLAGREVPADLAVYIAREAARGLHYAHNKTDTSGAPLSIIHRDISPQNILCSFMGEVKITDFGIAKASSIMNKTAVGILKGKYGYMSPEQARGQPLDHRSDVFNLGIVLYEMLVGERCFAGASDYSTLNLMREAVVTPPSTINKSVPAGLEEIVLKALQKEPGDRHQSALEVEGALADYARADTELGATDLARFLTELFSNTRPAGDGQSTGVLDLSSVVGPPAKDDGEKARSVRSKPARPSKADKKPAKPEKKRPRPENRPTPRSAVAEPPAPANAPEKTEDEPRPTPAPPKKKPARQPNAAAAEKKRKKAEAAANRKPVGRKDLKPGLTDLAALQRTGRKTRLAQLVVAVVVAAGIGAGLGMLSSSSSTQQVVFRGMEVANREPVAPGQPKQITVFVESDPAGASVWLDGNRLADRTPVSVKRAADTKAHQLELSRAGYKTIRREFRYQPGALTIVQETLDGETGLLKIRSSPSGLPVRIDGREKGATPLEVGVPPGKHEVEIGSQMTETRTVEVTVKPGKTHRISETVLRRGERGTLRIESNPVAKILLDGKPTGRLTNDGALQVEPGILHRITLVTTPDGARRKLRIRLKPGEQKRVYVDLGAL